MGLYEDLKNAIIEGNDQGSAQIAKKIVEQKLDIQDAIVKGLAEGMKIVGAKYEQREYFIPEIIICADALNAAFEVFKPYLKEQKTKPKATVVIGVVKGDIHDIGKNITALFLNIAGYKIIDLGRNVHSDAFIEAVEKNHAEVVCLSTLMSPTLEEMKRIVQKLQEKGLKKTVKVVIGGAPTDKDFANKIGADFYCKEAVDAVKLLDNVYMRGG